MQWQKTNLNTAKVKFLSFLFVLFSGVAFSQDNTKYDISLGIGVKHALFDYLNGGLFEIRVANPTKAWAFNLRQDVNLSLGKIEQDSLFHANSNYYGITKLYTQSYVEAEYLAVRKTNYQIAFHAAYGWVYIGKGNNIRLNREHGYSVASLATSYSRSWYQLELRGDVPLKPNYYANYNGGLSRLAPISLALKYRFRPKKA